MPVPSPMKRIKALDITVPSESKRQSMMNVTVEN